MDLGALKSGVNKVLVWKYDVEYAFPVASKKLEYGPGTIYAGVPSFFGFGVRVRSCSNFLVNHCSHNKSEIHRREPGSNLNQYIGTRTTQRVL